MNRRKYLASILGTCLAGCLRLEGSSTPTSRTPNDSTVVDSSPTSLATQERETTSKEGTPRTTAAPQETTAEEDTPKNTTASQEADAKLSITSNWPQYQYDSANTGYNPDSTGPTKGVERVWTFERTGTVPEFRSQSEEWSSFIPVIANGNVYISSQDNFIYSIDADTGEENWRFSMDTEDQDDGGRKSTPAVSDGVVIAEGSGGHLYGLDAKTGESLWIYRRNIGVSPVTPTVADGTVYTENEGDVLAIEVASGSLIWERSGLGSLVYQAVLDDGLYVPDQGHGSNTSRMIALDASSGETLWTVEGPSHGGAVLQNTIITWRKTSGVGEHLEGPPKLYALNRDSGEIRWEVELPSQPTTGGPPSVYSGRAYLGLSDGNLYAYDVDDGSRLWRAVSTASHISGLPTVVDGHVYFGSLGSVHCHRADDGARSWSFPVEEMVYGPTVVDNAVIVGTDSGKVHAFSELS